MPMAGHMSHIIPNHVLRVGQTVCQDPGVDLAEEDLDISLANLNQLIMDLDPTFEPLQFHSQAQNRSPHTEDYSPDQDVSRCMLVSRGCSPGVRLASSVLPSPSAGVPIPRHSGSSACPHGSVVFSGSPSSSRPPLPCGSSRRRRPGSQQGEAGVCGSPGTLLLSHRVSTASLLSTSPGSDTSYVMGSCCSLLSDDNDSPDGALLFGSSGSIGDASRPNRPLVGRQSQGIPMSPYPNVSPPSLGGSLTDIPVVLINGAPEGHPEGPIVSLGPQRQSLRRSSRSSSPHSRPSSLESRPFHGSQPSMKFVMDTSQFWFRPHITREEADALLRDQEPGSFVVRDSKSYRGSFGLAMKVYQVPDNPISTGKSDKGASELMRHFLIESSAKGVRVKGSSQEPYFGSLSALVYQHTITAFALPCKLVIHSQDHSRGEETDQVTTTKGETTKAACNFLYLSAVPTEMLTGSCAVQKAVSVTLEKEAGPSPATTPAIVNMKVSAKGVTLTDIQRKLFFRRHYPAHLLSYSGEDPDQRTWQKGCKPARLFGIVAKGTESGAENMCHVFAEYDPLQPSAVAIQLIQSVIGRTQP